MFFFFSSRRRHTRCALVTGVQTCALPISCSQASATVPKNGWSGCVIDRDQSDGYDMSWALPTTSKAATLYPADGDTFANTSSPNIFSASCATSPLMPLSTDWTALTNAITNLKSGGGTNTTIGLVWGWQMLTQGATLSKAAPVDTQKLDKVIVFLTDGMGTFNRNKPGTCEGTKDCDDVDDRTAAVYTALRNACILI